MHVLGPRLPSRTLLLGTSWPCRRPDPLLCSGYCPGSSCGTPIPAVHLEPAAGVLWCPHTKPDRCCSASCSSRPLFGQISEFLGLRLRLMGGKGDICQEWRRFGPEFRSGQLNGEQLTCLMASQTKMPPVRAQTCRDPEGL